MAFHYEEITICYFLFSAQWSVDAGCPWPLHFLMQRWKMGLEEPGEGGYNSLYLDLVTSWDCGLIARCALPPVGRDWASVVTDTDPVEGRPSNIAYNVNYFSEHFLCLILNIKQCILTCLFFLNG